MKQKIKSRAMAICLSLILVVSMSFGSVCFAADQITLTSAQEGDYIQEVIDDLAGGDGLYKDGVNGFEMYDHLGYVYMGWRTTGGIWQNQVINNYIMKELEDSGYSVSEDDVVAPYGQKSDSDKSDAIVGDYAWVTQYQSTGSKNLGNVWDPEYSSLNVKLTNAIGEDVTGDYKAKKLTDKVSGEQWGFNPTTVTYQKKFAETFDMDYENDIADLPSTDAKVLAMRDKLMSSDVDVNSRTTVDDYTYIKRDSIGEPNKEATLNQRTRLATNSCFTDPAGTDPSEAAGTEGEFIYVGTVNTRAWSNSEGIPGEDIAGKIILTDSSVSNGYSYAQHFGGIGVASKAAVDGEYCLTPRDDSGYIMKPWNTTSRYAGGASLNSTIQATESGNPIVEWQFSNEQYDSLKALLKKAATINANTDIAKDKVKVTAKQIAIGKTYPMTITSGKEGKGQAVAMAEIKGTVHPEKRVIIAAHVQEPGCNDNATGVASMLGIATKYKELIDAGKIERPQCTITFLWGDEMNLATYWMDSHPTEKSKVIGSLDMDMTGEDPDKTGGVMRIEKTPDPSADYNYALDRVPWEEADPTIPDKSYPGYDENYKDDYGDFVRLPDSHTLWGAGSTRGLFKQGWYLNDLYMYATSTVIRYHDKDFQVDVCPYEGGSDHSRFLAQNIPAMLTWHFTDYTYHTSVDTLYMSSPREMESVGITTLSTAIAMASTSVHNEAAILDILDAVKEAGLKRMAAEMTNTEHHVLYAKAGNQSGEEALADEKEVLQAWGDWYNDAIVSVLSLADDASADLVAAVNAAQDELAAAVDESLAYADEAFGFVAAREEAVAGLDEFMETLDVPEEIAADVEAAYYEAAEAIAKSSDPEEIAGILAETTQGITKMITDYQQEQEQEAEATLNEAKLAAQNELYSTFPEVSDAALQNKVLKATMDAIVAISEAQSEEEIQAALDEGKATVNALVAKVGSLTVKCKKRVFTVSWTEAEGATGYKVYYKKAKAKKYTLLTDTAGLSAKTKKLKKGKKYMFKVVPYTVLGDNTIGGIAKVSKKVKCKK